MLSVNPLPNKHWFAVFFWGQHPSCLAAGSWQQMLSCIYRRVRRCPRGRREKLMLARRETTLQKMEMPKQTRYPSSLLCSRIDSFPSPTRTGLGLWQGRVFLTTLNADGDVGKELKLSVCQGMLPHGSYCSSVKFTKQLLSCVLQVPQMLNLILLKIRAVQLREDLFCSGFCYIEKWVSFFFMCWLVPLFLFRHRKPKVLVKPSETCEFLITVYFWWLYSLKYYFLSSFITMQNFGLLFFKLCC